jgi:hypothetical protein
MRLNHIAFVTLLIAPVLVTAQGESRSYEDRIAVEDVMARYVWAVDSLDADGYVAVFTEDAVIDSNGSISKRTRGDSQDRHEPHSAARRQQVREIADGESVPRDQQRAHDVPETRRGLAPVVLADRAPRQEWPDDCGRDGPL